MRGGRPDDYGHHGKGNEFFIRLDMCQNLLISGQVEPPLSEAESARGSGGGGALREQQVPHYRRAQRGESVPVEYVGGREKYPVRSPVFCRENRHQNCRGESFSEHKYRVTIQVVL